MSKALLVFSEGLLSFFSPCVLPLVPLYMAYLSSGVTSKNDEIVKHDQRKIFILTLCFILGIYACFGILSLSVNTLSKYIVNYRKIISIVGGSLLILFGLNQTGILKISLLNREIRFDYRIENNKVNYIEAFMLGFVFSFAWTPCIGPMLSNAILLTTLSSAQSTIGSFYIMIYGLGLTLPFFITGIFTTYVIKFINSHKSLTKYVSIISGIVVILFGIYMIYTSTIKSSNESISIEQSSSQHLPIDDFETLSGKKISLYSDGDIALHYVASWCNYCIEEEPYFEEFCNEHDNITCYLVMSESVNQSKGGSSTKEFVERNHPNLDIIIDNDLALYSYLNPTGFPSTYFADDKGIIYGLIPGAAYENYNNFYNELLNNKKS